MCHRSPRGMARSRCQLGSAVSLLPSREPSEHTHWQMPLCLRPNQEDCDQKASTPCACRPAECATGAQDAWPRFAADRQCRVPATFSRGFFGTPGGRRLCVCCCLCIRGCSLCSITNRYTPCSPFTIFTINCRNHVSACPLEVAALTCLQEATVPLYRR